VRCVANNVISHFFGILRSLNKLSRCFHCWKED